MSLFQSNLRKQIRNLPRILNFVKIIHYYSKLFTGVLSCARSAGVEDEILEAEAARLGDPPEERRLELLRRVVGAHAVPARRDLDKDTIE